MAENEQELDKEQNFFAETVEVRMKMYSCRICSIRYDSIAAVKNHYYEVHATAPDDDFDNLENFNDTSTIATGKIKEEIEDEIVGEINNTTATNNDGGLVLVLYDENDQIKMEEDTKPDITRSTGRISMDVISDHSGFINIEEDEDSYPTEYTPTSKVKKGRQIEPKEDDSHLRKFPCPFQGCNYIAKYRSNLWDHKKTHTGEKPYVCNWPSCTMRFSQTHQLKLHLRSHTGERPYVCDWPGCFSAFSQKPGLKSHMLTHTGEKPFKCDYPGCAWSFRLKGALTDHKRAIHENAKKHVCEWPGCNKRFLQQCHLKKHIMGHADIKPFACDWPNCDYKAVTMAYVTNHRKTHTGEKNYECTFPNCNKRFVKSSHVNRHRQRCHPELFLILDEMGIEDGNEIEENNDGINNNIDSVNNNVVNDNNENTPSKSSRKTRSVVLVSTKQQNGDQQQDEQINDDSGEMNGNAQDKILKNLKRELRDDFEEIEETPPKKNVESVQEKTVPSSATPTKRVKVATRAASKNISAPTRMVTRARSKVQ